MRISVVIPIHNRQMLGERALRSALAQGVEGMEIVVVDDGSQPPFHLPADIAASANVRVVRHENNCGESSARNSGVGAARADWVAFLDSDDYWLADTLRPRLEVAEKDWNASPGRMSLHAAGFVVDNKRTGQRTARIPRESGSPTDFASGCWFAPGSTILFRQEIFDRVGSYDPMLPRLTDLDWFLRFALAGGQLKVWQRIVAVVETGPKARPSTLEQSAGRLHEKYGRETSPCRLPPELQRRLDAYLDVERASIFMAQRNWFRFLFHIGRSLWRVPRLRIHLKRFWRIAAMPHDIEPAGLTGTRNAQHASPT